MIIDGKVTYCYSFIWKNVLELTSVKTWTVRSLTVACLVAQILERSVAYKGHNKLHNEKYMELLAINENIGNCCQINKLLIF